MEGGDAGGAFSITVTLTYKNGTTNTFVLNVSYVDSLGGHSQMYTLMGDVPQGNFMLDGSNWVVRRCT